jgi:F-type H+-transporting ATPase subunit b
MRIKLSALIVPVTLAAVPAIALAEDAAHAVAGAAHAAAAEGHGGGGGLLDVNGWGALWNLGLFLVLLAVLSKFVWPSILKGLQAREEKIRTDITAAESANKAAQKTLAEYQQKLAEAHAEARKLVESARQDAEAVRARLSHETEQQIAAMQKRASDEINQARTAAVQELYARAAELSVAVAEKILQRQFTESDTKSLIDQSLKELDKLKVG